MSLSKVFDLGPIVPPEQFIGGLFNSPLVGIAILDRRLRYQLVNKTLAKMNGVPLEAHFDKTVPDILGNFATAIMPALEGVLASGESTANLEVSGQLAARKDIGRWAENYFPIRNSLGKVDRVASVVVEMPQHTPSEFAHATADFFGSPQRSVNSTQARLLVEVQRVFAPKDSASRPELLRGLYEKDVRMVLAAARHATRYQGESFCSQAAPARNLYLLTNGLAKVGRISETGREVLLGWARTGDVLGLSTLAPGAPLHESNVYAVAKTEALEWDSTTISRFADSCPRFYRNVLTIALRWARELTERLEEVSTKSVEQRLAGLVLLLAERFRDVGPAELRTSDEELAQMTGTTLFTVNKTIRAWQRMGYVKKSRRHLLIVDGRGLLSISTAGRT